MSLITRILLGAAAALVAGAWLSLVGMAAAAAVVAGPQQLDRPALSAYHQPPSVYIVHKG